MASTVEPSHEEERELYNLANNVPFDDRICHAAEVRDLSAPLIKAYLREVGSSLYDRADSMDFTELCRDMNIVDGPPEYTKPRNVGLLFFSMDPERFFPYSARIEVADQRRIMGRLVGETAGFLSCFQSHFLSHFGQEMRQVAQIHTWSRLSSARKAEAIR